jgi:hypothetical protein
VRISIHEFIITRGLDNSRKCSRWDFFNYPDPTKYARIDINFGCLLQADVHTSFQWTCKVSAARSARLSTKYILTMCSYINRTAAFDSGLVYYEDNGTVIMKADDTTHLPKGDFRNRFTARYLSKNAILTCEQHTDIKPENI